MIPNVGGFFCHTCGLKHDVELDHYRCPSSRWPSAMAAEFRSLTMRGRKDPLPRVDACKLWPGNPERPDLLEGFQQALERQRRESLRHQTT